MLKVTLIGHTPDPERLVAAAAKLCYSDQSVEGLLDGLTPDKTAGFIGMLMELGHESPIEHVSFTFAIEGVSRSLLAQITRHRIASYSVQSQRYVSLDDPKYVVPPEIENEPEAMALFEQAMRFSAQSYAQIGAVLKDKHTKRFLAEGMSEKQAAAKAEKMALEDARFVLPNAAQTKMIVTMNARSLINFFHHRCCSRAQWEIRALADEMLRLVKQAAPTLFADAGPPCVSLACPEGKMSCGQAAQMRERYKGAAVR
jgi:thymidylate synthase (FAD)